MLPNSLTDSIKSKVLDSASDKLGAKKITPANAILNVIAKNFLLFPSIARDVNVARQNMQILVKMAGGKSTNRADSTKEEDDKKQKKIQAKSKKSPTPEAQDSDGLGSKIGRKIWSKIKKSKIFRKIKIGFKKLKRNIVNIIKKMFNKKLLAKIFSPKNLLKVLFNIVKVAGPIGLIVSIVSSIGVGFYDAWNEYQKSGDFFESLKAGLAGILDFLSFGLFGKEEIDKLFKWIPELWQDFSKAFFDFKESAIKFVSEKFTMILDFFGPNQKLLPDTKEVSTDKTGNQKDLDKSLNEAKNNIQTLQFIKSQLESDLQRLQKDNDRLDEQIATLTAQVSALSSKKTPVSPEPVAPSAPTPTATPTAAPTAARAGVAPSPAPAAVPDKKPEGVGSGGKFSKEDDFVSSLKPWAEYVSKAIGGKVPPFAILGQWAGESGTGKSLPADYNYAGIKAGKSFQKGDFVLTEERYTDKQLKQAEGGGEELAKFISGPNDTIKKKGREVTIDEWFGKGSFQKAKDEGKNWVQVKSYFAKFKDLKDFSDSFAKFISSPRYAKAREQTTAAGFGLEIAKAGYATAAAEKYSAKVAAFDSKYSGAQIASASNSVAVGQREQLKPTGVNVINMEKTNNKTVAINQTKVTDKHQGKAADTLVARAA